MAALGERCELPGKKTIDFPKTGDVDNAFQEPARVLKKVQRKTRRQEKIVDGVKYEQVKLGAPWKNKTAAKRLTTWEGGCPRP